MSVLPGPTSRLRRRHLETGVRARRPKSCAPLPAHAPTGGRRSTALTSVAAACGSADNASSSRRRSASRSAVGTQRVANPAEGLRGRRRTPGESQLESRRGADQVAQAAQCLDVEPSVTGVGDERQLRVVRRDALVAGERQGQADAGCSAVENSNGDQIVSAHIAQDRCVEFDLRVGRLAPCCRARRSEEVEARAPNEQDPRTPRSSSTVAARIAARARPPTLPADERSRPANQP